MTTFRDQVASWLPDWLADTNGDAFTGVVFGLIADVLADAMSVAIRMPWLKDDESPDDALPLVAAERKLIRYPNDTALTWRDRLWRAWDIYRFAGSENAIEEQAAAAGFPAEVRFYPDRKGPREEAAPYWSQFWLYFAPGDHPVTGTGQYWGEFTWGVGHSWGVENYTDDFRRTITYIVAKLKSVRWICRGFELDMGDLEYGDGTKYGDAGKVYGAQITVSASG